MYSATYVAVKSEQNCKEESEEIDELLKRLDWWIKAQAWIGDDETVCCNLEKLLLVHDLELVFFAKWSYRDWISLVCSRMTSLFS